MILANLNKIELSKLLLEINNTPLKYRKKLNVRENIYFGNEIETDNLKEDIANNIIDILNKRYLYDSYYSFYISEDDSCDVEIATPPFTNTVFDWKLFEKAYDMIRSNGARITDNTSSHIHVSSNQIDTKEKLITLLKLAFTFEDIIYKFGYGYQNTPRKYILAETQPIFSTILNPEDIKTYIEALNTSINLKNILIHLKNRNNMNYINFKYFNINKFENSKKAEDHIEFRNFNGTLYPEIAQNNINLILNIIEAIIDNRIDLNLLNKLYNLELIYKEKYKNIITNTVAYFHKDYYDDYNKIVKSYSNTNLRKALILADMIFKEEIDKYYFLKQYLKLFSIKEENIKKITM